MVARLAVPTTRERCTDPAGATLVAAHDEPISGVIVDAKPLAATAAGPSETVDDTSDGSSETDDSENDTSSETSGTDSVEDNNANEEVGENDECVTDEPDASKPSEPDVSKPSEPDASKPSESDAVKLSEPALKLSGPDAVKPSGDVFEKGENVSASDSLPELQSGITLGSFFLKSCSF